MITWLDKSTQVLFIVFKGKQSPGLNYSGISNKRAGMFHQVGRTIEDVTGTHDRDNH